MHDAHGHALGFALDQFVKSIDELLTFNFFEVSVWK
jgi:hypothetical protein